MKLEKIEQKWLKNFNRNDDGYNFAFCESKKKCLKQKKTLKKLFAARCLPHHTRESFTLIGESTVPILLNDQAW